MIEIYVTIKDGFIEGFSFDILDDGIVVQISKEQFDDFDVNYRAYRLVEAELIKDANRQEELEIKQSQQQMREIREIECFAVINRGVLWYNTLTPTEQDDLNRWYLEWLDAPETLEIPEKPEWLD